MAEKFEDIVAKICHFVISDVIKTGLSAVCRDVTRGTEVDATILYITNIIWSFMIAAMVLIVEARTCNTAVAILMDWERSLTS